MIAYCGNYKEVICATRTHVVAYCGSIVVTKEVICATRTHVIAYCGNSGATCTTRAHVIAYCGN